MRLGRLVRLASGVAAMLLALALPAGAAPPEAALRAAAQAEQPALVTSLEQMVLIESGSGNSRGPGARWPTTPRHACGRSVRATERSKATRGPGTLVKGSFSGTGTKKLMLIAHMDTVYPAGTLAVRALSPATATSLYGPGIADDKSGIAVILHALAILNGRRLARLRAAHRAVQPRTRKSARSDRARPSPASPTSTTTCSRASRPGQVGRGQRGPPARRRCIGTGDDGSERSRRACRRCARGRPQCLDRARATRCSRLATSPRTSPAPSSTGPGRRPASSAARFRSGRRQAPTSRITTPGAAEKLNTALQEKVAASKLVEAPRPRCRVEIGRPAFHATERARAFARQAQAIYAELDGRRSASGRDGSAAPPTPATPVARARRSCSKASAWPVPTRTRRASTSRSTSIVPRLYLLARMLQTAARAPTDPAGLRRAVQSSVFSAAATPGSICACISGVPLP